MSYCTVCCAGSDQFDASKIQEDRCPACGTPHPRVYEKFFQPLNVADPAGTQEGEEGKGEPLPAGQRSPRKPSPAAAVIADALSHAGKQADSDDEAALVIDALEEAGYRIVQAPPPLEAQDGDMVAYDGNFQEWYQGVADYAARCNEPPFDKAAAREGWNGGIRFYAREARSAPPSSAGPSQELELCPRCKRHSYMRPEGYCSACVYHMLKDRGTLPTPAPQGVEARPMKLRAVVYAYDTGSSFLEVYAVREAGENLLFSNAGTKMTKEQREIAYRINHFEPAPLSGEGDKP